MDDNVNGKRIKFEDKWHIYAIMGENDDLRMDGQEPERDYDHLLDQLDSEDPVFGAAEKAFYEKYGYEPVEDHRNPKPWPAPATSAIRVRLNPGARWRVLASELPALIGTLFESTTCNTLSFEASCQKVEGVSVLELVFRDSGFAMLSFHAFSWQNLPYWLKAVEGKRFRVECLRRTGDIWFGDPVTGDPMSIGQMLELPQVER